MLENYLIVHKSILPDFFDNILEAKHLLEEGKAKNVMQATKMVGISRSTFYKYKDYILEPIRMSEGRKAVISMLLSHETGILSHVLTKVSDAGASILTITQSLPVHGKASVTITLDISGMPSLVTGLLKDIDECQGVENTKLIAID
ncbi:MAG: ACT domain-containing protein [Spirochaetales bacterium]|nr:ACT domain-containing protein [Spirochaetales bacterium]MBQ7508165.1 ACT domain-containing protein [Spirochaetales bacterium]MBR6347591.1 ACT domain-containing protein [Spirochaetales bacterium]